MSRSGTARVAVLVPAPAGDAQPWHRGDFDSLRWIALILLAAAVLMLPSILAPDGPRWLTWGLGAAMSSSVVAVGAITWIADHVGHPVFESALTVPALFWVLGWPLALVVLAALATGDTGRTWWRLAALGLLFMSTPMAEFILAPLLLAYASHDTTPWSEAVGAVCLVATAGALWVGTSSARIRSGPPSATAAEDPAAGAHGPLPDGAAGSMPT